LLRCIKTTSAQLVHATTLFGNISLALADPPLSFFQMAAHRDRPGRTDAALVGFTHGDLLARSVAPLEMSLGSRLLTPLLD
jgi:hypothetical protein